MSFCGEPENLVFLMLKCEILSFAQLDMP